MKLKFPNLFVIQIIFISFATVNNILEYGTSRKEYPALFNTAPVPSAFSSDVGTIGLFS